MLQRIKKTNGQFSVGTSTERITIRHRGSDYNAQVVRAASDKGKLCFVLAYEWKLWNPPIFGDGDLFLILDTKQRIVAQAVHLADALALAGQRMCGEPQHRHRQRHGRRNAAHASGHRGSGCPRGAKESLTRGEGQKRLTTKDHFYVRKPK